MFLTCSTSCCLVTASGTYGMYVCMYVCIMYVCVYVCMYVFMYEDIKDHIRKLRLSTLVAT